MEKKTSLLATSMITQIAKECCGIHKDNKDLTDDDIRDVCRYFATFAPDTTYVDGVPKFGEVGIGLMLSLALYEFPEFYERYELWQRH